MIKVRPEEHIEGSDSVIALNRRDMQRKFRYVTLCENPEL